MKERREKKKKGRRKEETTEKRKAAGEVLPVPTPQRPNGKCRGRMEGSVSWYNPLEIAVFLYFYLFIANIAYVYSGVLLPILLLNSTWWDVCWTWMTASAHHFSPPHVIRSYGLEWKV